MGLLASGLTDIGRKRKTNQDALYLNLEKRYFIIADGMGGHKGGDIASKMVVDITPRFFFAHPQDDPVGACKKAIEFVHQEIREHSKSDKKLSGMGTTLNGLFFKGSKLYLSNVGDSRCYLINQGLLYQLSRDHSLVQEKINLDIYTREEAKKDPQKNILTRAIGLEGDIEVDIYSYKVSYYDIFLSCSDGLHGKVSNPDILHIINTHIPHPKEVQKDSLDSCVKALVDQANANGGDDNISAILVVAV